MEMREYFLLVIHAGWFIGGVSDMHNCPRCNLDFGQIKRAGKKTNKRTNKIKTDYGEQANSSFTIFSPKKKKSLTRSIPESFSPLLSLILSYAPSTFNSRHPTLPLPPTSWGSCLSPSFWTSFMSKVEVWCTRTHFSPILAPTQH